MRISARSSCSFDPGGKRNGTYLCQKLEVLCPHRSQAAERGKIAFICPFGTFRFLRIPFGLTPNAQATFQRLIDHFRTGLQAVLILSYLDDITALSDSSAECFVETTRFLMSSCKFNSLKI